MSDIKDTKEKVENKTEATPDAKADVKTDVTPEVKKDATPEAKKPEVRNERPQREFKKNRRSPRRGPRKRSEFEQKILDIRRVTRVSSGGRRFSFSVSIAVGNKRGKIGVGVGKAGDTSFAIQKAVKNAENNTIDIKMTKDNSIPHEVKAKFNSARVLIMPAKGRGVIAGSALRDLIELGGLNDINGKIISGSKNKLNIAKATLKALTQIDKTVKDDDKNLKKKESPKAFDRGQVRRERRENRRTMNRR